jgi:hypothetical protein
MTPDETIQVIFWGVGLGIFGCGLQLAVLAIPFSIIKSYRDKNAQLIEPGLNLNKAHACAICGNPRHLSRLKKCVNCEKYFCYYPSNSETPKEKWDRVAIKVAWILGILLTIGSLGLGLYLLALLSIPYWIFRAFLPNTLPLYWKQCGGSYKCNDCLSVSPSPVYISTYSNSDIDGDPRPPTPSDIYDYPPYSQEIDRAEPNHGDSSDSLFEKGWGDWLFNTDD